MPAGLSLAGFQAFIDCHGGRFAFLGLTTDDVKHKIVLPITGHKRESYCAQLLAAKSPHVAAGANVFISHAYSYPFLDVIDAVSAWEEQQLSSGPFFFYFDLLAVNQHNQGPKVEFEVLHAEFSRSVVACGRTLLVLRWADPVHLATSRAWCILEVATSLARLGQECLEIILPPKDSAKLSTALEQDSSSVEIRLCTIDAAVAGAREPDDLDRIQRMITEKLGGYVKVNERVLDGLRECLLSAANKELEKRAPGDTSFEALDLSVCNFMRTLGRTKKGEERLRNALKEREQRLAAEPESVERKLSVANVLSSLGSTVRLADGDGPIPMLEYALAIQTEHLSPSNDALVTTRSRLGVAQKDAGNFKEARLLCEHAFKARRDKFGMDHIDTLFSFMNLAMLFDAMKEYSAHGDIPAHDDIVDNVLRRRKSLLGVRHPHTLFARHRWGAVLMRQNRLEEAAKDMDEVCLLQTSVFGIAHKETLSSRSLRAQIWHKQGRSDDARLEFLEVREELICQFGDTHVDTIQVTSKLADLLFDADPAAGLKEHCCAVKGVLKTRGSAANPRLCSVLESAEDAAQRSLKALAPDVLEQGVLKLYKYLHLRWVANQLLVDVKRAGFQGARVEIV